MANDELENLNGLIQTELNINSDTQFDFLKTIGSMAKMGISEEDIGLVLGIIADQEPVKLANWKSRWPLLKKYMSDSRRNVLHYALAKLVRSACGYDYVERTFKYRRARSGHLLGDGIDVTETYKHKPSDVKALTFLICNIDKENWKSITKTEVDSRSISLNLDGKTTAAQIAKLAGQLAKQDEKKAISRTKQIDSKSK